MDHNVRYIATEGFCKLLMCERINNPQDYISRLILLKFEKPAGDQVEKTDQKDEKKDKTNV